MWAKQSHLLHPLTALMSNRVPFKCTDAEQKAFYEIKRIVACNTLLIYPYSSKRFDIHTDASDFHLGALIIQYGKTISFYSRELTVL